MLGSVQTDLGVEWQLNDLLAVHGSFAARWYYLQRINNTAPLLRKDFWLGGNIGVSVRI
jgi:hypothetical protein